MRRWESAYLGRSSLPKDVSEFELQRAFTFNHRERRDIRKAIRVRYRLAAALQLGLLRLTGKALASVAYVPTGVLHHLGRQFRGSLPDLATLRALYRRKPTRFEHHRWAVEHGHANEMFYDRIRNTMRLKGDAYLTNGCYELHSADLVYQLAMQRVMAEPSDHSGISGVRSTSSACSGDR
jgi:hypothetical protein